MSLTQRTERSYHKVNYSNERVHRCFHSNYFFLRDSNQFYPKKLHMKTEKIHFRKKHQCFELIIRKKTEHIYE